MGDGTSCEGDPCGGPTGACCINGECEEMSRDECIGKGGTYLGEGSTCFVEPLRGGEGETGACCFVEREPRELFTLGSPRLLAAGTNVPDCCCDEPCWYKMDCCCHLHHEPGEPPDSSFPCEDECPVSDWMGWPYIPCDVVDNCPCGCEGFCVPINNCCWCVSTQSERVSEIPDGGAAADVCVFQNCAEHDCATCCQTNEPCWLISELCGFQPPQDPSECCIPVFPCDSIEREIEFFQGGCCWKVGPESEQTSTLDEGMCPGSPLPGECDECTSVPDLTCCECLAATGAVEITVTLCGLDPDEPLGCQPIDCNGECKCCDLGEWTYTIGGSPGGIDPDTGEPICNPTLSGPLCGGSCVKEMKTRCGCTELGSEWDCGDPSDWPAGYCCGCEDCPECAGANVWGQLTGGCGGGGSDNPTMTIALEGSAELPQVCDECCCDDCPLTDPTCKPCCANSGVLCVCDFSVSIEIPNPCYDPEP